MFQGQFLWVLPALAACSSFKTIVTDSPSPTLVHINSLPEGAYLARRGIENSNFRRQFGGCGLAQVDCGNGYCCHTASSCAMQDGQTVCLPGGVAFAPHQPAFRASEDPISPVTPTPSSPASPTPMSSDPTPIPADAAGEEPLDTGSAAPVMSAGPPEPLSSNIPASSEDGRADGPDSGGSSLSGGAIAGIVVGVIIAVLIVVGIIGYLVFRARKRHKIEYDAPAATNGVSYETKKPIAPAELDGIERAEMEASDVDDMGKSIPAAEPQEMMGTIPVAEKTG